MADKGKCMSDSGGAQTVVVSQPDSGKGGRLKFLITGLVVGAIIVAVVIFKMTGGSSMFGAEDFVTSSQLKDAVNIEQLSSAEFVYNGIAEKYREDSDEVEYRISYDATLKVGINMSDIVFTVDDDAKTVKAQLPPIAITNISVSTEGLSYLPENPNLDMADILTICEEDIKNEAAQSPSFYQTAEENMRDVVEALTLPLIKGKGYSLEWEEPVPESEIGVSE